IFKEKRIFLATMMKKLYLTLAGCIYIAATISAQTTGLQEQLPLLMHRDHIPGLSAAYIYHGKVTWVQHFGTADETTHSPVTDSTLFEAASLTKVVTAYAAMQLISEGKLNPDKPLNEYLGNNYDIGNDPRIHKITARRVLSHSAGLPNWRPNKDSSLPINFTPGDHFSYSGEGFVYLAIVMEKITGMPYEQLINKRVFLPLGMKHSHLTYLPTIKSYARRHDWMGNPTWLPDYTNINAAASLRTTAKDYATFLAAILNTPKGMFQTQIHVDTAKAPQLSWGLGVGLDSVAATRYCWHWGDQGDSRAFFCGDISKKDGIVFLTNSANGLSIVPDVLEVVFGPQQLDINKFVAYGKFEPTALTLIQTIQKDGAGKALIDSKIDEDHLNTIGYYFLNKKDYTNAIGVFAKATTDHPDSYNAWDSLAEAYMNQGNKEKAIEYYEKSLVLNPQNNNAVEKLKELRK
ncbi:serine hydrolase, partial [[Flexibacter] sp. ATCC 35208]|uniref:serine hydrolase n=1 Tax=[Flexibacter] sp. ATCC 35208 TaxID=1936242 RepID=UPI0009C94F1C